MNLITGGAGTLGSEFAKQLLEKGEEVLVVDNCEWAIAQLFDHPKLIKRLSDFSTISGKYSKIIHCAAYKHVDLIENNQDEALLNNVVKTKKLYDNCVTNKLLFISTDKAVEPESYYGQTKQRGEELTRDYDGVIARLGNIMASSGSVIPKWEKCIEEGNPLPITDPKMTRYMIPVDRAVRFILNLLHKTKPGQIIIPEMGEPIGLIDLAQRVCDKKGVELNYEVIGLRPGEKIHEKLKWDNEQLIYKNKCGGVYESFSNRV